MAIPIRTAIPGTYFITTATYQRRRIFQVDRNAQLFLDIIARHRTNFLLHAYVLMPDHIHLILTPQAITLERTMQLLKGSFSHALQSKLPVWQRSFTDHRIRDTEDFGIRKNYIHQNPVAAHIVSSAEEYPHSSANRKILLDPMPENLRG
jgi:putative transposase